ncbi:hypothetical protein ACSMXN_17925 [Jatrophihabitans sp. DSM 45814]
MTAAAFNLDPEEADLPNYGVLNDQAAEFDDTDGAYAVAEPDPFSDHPHSHPHSYPHSHPNSYSHSPDSASSHRHPSLRTELRASPAGPMATLARPCLPPLPLHPGLESILPDGLRRGSTIAITSSVSLLLAVLGGPSAKGAWTAMVGMPAISAEAAAEAGIDLERLAIIGPPESGWTSASWTTAVGALLDAVDVVVGRPGIASATAGNSTTIRTGASGINDGDARRLTARARSKDAVLVLFGQHATAWPAVEVQLSAQHSHWTGIGDGYGRIKAHRVTVSAVGKGRSARPRTADLWLPSAASVTQSPSTGTRPSDSQQTSSRPVRGRPAADTRSSESDPAATALAEAG